MFRRVFGFYKVGSPTTVRYELGTTGLINFIQHWIKLNKDNLIWADKEPSKDFTLPYIKHDKCPRNKEHKGLIKDLAGRVRYAHRSEEKLKPSFITSYKTFDKLSNMDVIECYEQEPIDPSYGEMMEFNNEEPIIIPDVCYAILSDEKSILSLETVLDRLNLEPRMKTVYCHEIGPCERLDELSDWARECSETTTICPGHLEENNMTVHGFSGWTLAWYVQKWYEQVSDGKARVFERVR